MEAAEGLGGSSELAYVVPGGGGWATPLAPLTSTTPTWWGSGSGTQRTAPSQGRAARDPGAMELPARLSLLGLCFVGALAGQPQLTQVAPSHVVDEKIPRLRCQMSESDIATHVLSWYHQAPGQGPTFLLSHRAGESKPTYGTGVSERFIADLERDTNTFSLTIGNVNPADAGTYYCAVWYANQYLFGEGTRLILGGDTRKKRAPEVALLGPVRVAHPAFLCLAWGFSPEPIRVHWQVDGQDPGSGEASLPVKSQDGTSTVSLLSLPAQAWLAGAQVTCRVEHETQVQQSSSEIKGAGRQGCSVSAGDPLLLPDPFSNGTAGSTAPQSTGAPSLGRILLTAWRCYLGLLAASCFYSLGLSFLMGLQGCRKNQGPQSSVAAPCPQEAQQRVPQRRTGKDRCLE